VEHSRPVSVTEPRVYVRYLILAGTELSGGLNILPLAVIGGLVLVPVRAGLSSCSP